MAKISAAILGAIVGGLAAAAGLLLFLDWGTQGAGQLTYTDPTRADYVDLLLSLVTVLLAAVGLAVTVGALVIGFVAFKTLREIKNEAANTAQAAAATKINEALPEALRSALVDDAIGHRILSEMTQKGELDKALERVAMRLQSAGPEPSEDENS